MCRVCTSWRAVRIGLSSSLPEVDVVSVLVVFGLEALQLLTPDRHGHLLDATEKAAGALGAACFVRLIQIFRGDTKQV